MDNEVRVVLYGGGEAGEEIRLDLHKPTAKEIQEALIDTILQHGMKSILNGFTIVTRGVEAEFVVLVLGVLVQRNIISYKNLWFEVEDKQIRMGENGELFDRWPGGFFTERMPLLTGNLIGESNDDGTEI